MSVEPTDTDDWADKPRVSLVSRQVLSDQWARLEQVEFDYRRGDGRTQRLKREIYHRGHGAAVLLFNRAQRTIVLTRQFRFPAYALGESGFLIEVPAGIIEGENPEETIRLETQQETGFVIDEPVFLFRAYATPGSVTEQLYYYACEYDPARRVSEGGGLEDEGEDIEVMQINIEQAVEWIAQGRVVDAKTIILIQHALIHLFPIDS